MFFLLIVLKWVNFSDKLLVKTTVLYKLMSADSLVIITELSVSVRYIHFGLCNFYLFGL